MRIRRSTKKDIKEIAKIMLDGFKRPPFNERANITAVLKSLNFYFDIGRICVAVHKREIIGVLVFKVEQYWEGPVIIIEDLAVKKEFRKQGIGKMLMENLEYYAKKNKLKRILFKTHKKSVAVKFYQKMGYKPRSDIIHFEKKIKRF